MTKKEYNELSEVELELCNLHNVLIYRHEAKGRVTKAYVEKANRVQLKLQAVLLKARKQLGIDA